MSARLLGERACYAGGSGDSACSDMLAYGHLHVRYALRFTGRAVQAVEVCSLLETHPYVSAFRYAQGSYE